MASARLDNDDIIGLSHNDAIAPFTPDNQQWGVIVYVGPDSDQQCDRMAINFLGAFGSIEDAKRYATQLKTERFNMFTMYVIEMNKLIAFPPPKDVNDRNYSNETLDKIMNNQKQRMYTSEQRMNSRIDDLHKMEAKRLQLIRDKKNDEANELYKNIQIAKADEVIRQRKNGQKPTISPDVDALDEKTKELLDESEREVTERAHALFKQPIANINNPDEVKIAKPRCFIGKAQTEKPKNGRIIGKPK